MWAWLQGLLLEGASRGRRAERGWERRGREKRGPRGRAEASVLGDGVMLGWGSGCSRAGCNSDSRGCERLGRRLRGCSRWMPGSRLQCKQDGVRIGRARRTWADACSYRACCYCR